VAGAETVAMSDAEAAFARPAPPDAGASANASHPASALLRAAPRSDAEGWIARAAEQIRRGRLRTPAGDNARDSLLSAQRSDASYAGLPAAVAGFIDASADAAARNIGE